MRKFLTLLLLFTLWSCQSESRNPLRHLELKTSAGDSIKTTLVYTPKDMETGLSGTKSEDWGEDQGMLFFYLEDNDKYFWMPDTYFDLDIFYLDKDMKILDVVRKVPHYVGRLNPDLIPRVRGVWCRHVLELKSSSPIAAKINVGDKLEWKSSLSIEETEAKIKTHAGN